MKIVLAMFADFHETFLGGPSQLGTRIGSRTVFGHALRRAAQVERVDAACVFVRQRDAEAARAALADAGLSERFELLPLDDGRRPRRSLIRSARKWTLDAWRGSPLGTTWFDEYVEPINVGRVTDHYEADAVLCLDGHQPALDPAIATRMLAHYRENAADAPFVFTQAPPGLAGIVLGRPATRRLLETQAPVGMLLAYRPEAPQIDLITKPMCCRIDAAVCQTPARLTGDTKRGRELLGGAFAALGDDAAADELCAWLREDGYERTGGLPLEVEIELTTDDPLPATQLRPRGDRLPSRTLEDFAALERVARELAEYDDRMLVFGGHGDPLLHPRVIDACRIARDGGVCAIAIRSPLVRLSDVQLEGLLAARVDVLQALLDAHSPETYTELHGADHFEQVVLNIDRVQIARGERQIPQPIVVPSITRCTPAFPEIERFFDDWIARTGWAVIEGYSDYGGLLAEEPLLQATPPVRERCGRLASRMTLLADGTAVLCDQDPLGRQPIGNWFEMPLRELFAGSERANAQEKHAVGGWGELPLCGACRQWFRP